MKNHIEDRKHAETVCGSDRRSARPGVTGRLMQRMAWGLLACTALAGAPLLAQATTADVIGNVTDASGAVVPNAAVELTNIETHETHTATSGSSGEFTFTLLKP